MSAVTTTLTGVCTGGNHLTFTLSGDVTLTQVIDLSELAVAPSADDAKTFLRVVAWMAKNGRTLNQAKTLLQNGVTITI